MIKIVAMGDSITAGYPGFSSPIESPPDGAGDERSQYEYWMVKEHRDWMVLNRGINGERTDHMVARFEKDVADERPNLVVVLGGINDVYQGFTAKFVTLNLSRMYTLALDASIVPVACTVLPYNMIEEQEASVRNDVNAWIERESAKLGIPFCDTARVASDPGDPDRLFSTPDGYHPDVRCYRRIGDEVSRTIEAYLKSESLPK